MLLARRDVRMTGGAHGRYEAASEVRCVPLCSRLCVPAALRSTCSVVAPTARGARAAGRRSRMGASTCWSRCAASAAELGLYSRRRARAAVQRVHAVQFNAADSSCKASRRCEMLSVARCGGVADLILPRPGWERSSGRPVVG